MRQKNLKTIKMRKIMRGNGMKIINFEKAKERRHSKQKNVKYLTETSNDEMELQREYRELVQFYNQWYDEHVVGQDENGRWIYKD